MQLSTTSYTHVHDVAVFMHGNDLDSDLDFPVSVSASTDFRSPSCFVQLGGAGRLG